MSSDQPFLTDATHLPEPGSTPDSDATLDSDTSVTPHRDTTQASRIEHTMLDVDWEDLVLSLPRLQVRILEVLYLPEDRSLSLPQLCRRLRPLGFCQRTIRRHLEKLASLQLLELIRSVVTLVCPVPGLQGNIKRLTMLWNLRERNL